MQYETKTHRIHTDKHKKNLCTVNRPIMTKPNPEKCKNCSSKCAYDCAQLQYTIQHRTVLIIFPLTSRQTAQLRCHLNSQVNIRHVLKLRWIVMYSYQFLVVRDRSKAERPQFRAASRRSYLAVKLGHVTWRQSSTLDVKHVILPTHTCTYTVVTMPGSLSSNIQHDHSAASNNIPRLFHEAGAMSIDHT